MEMDEPAGLQLRDRNTEESSFWLSDKKKRSFHSNPFSMRLQDILSLPILEYLVVVCLVVVCSITAVCVCVCLTRECSFTHNAEVCSVCFFTPLWSDCLICRRMTSKHVNNKIQLALITFHYRVDKPQLPQVSKLRLLGGFQKLHDSLGKLTPPHNGICSN